MTKDTIYVKIRTWSDMLSQYGHNHLDESVIEIPKRFTSKMENIIPSDRIIEVELRLRKDSYRWYPKDCEDFFIISEEMIEQKYGSADPRICPSIIVPTKNTKISEPVYHMKNAYYLSTDGGYLHSDMIIRTSTGPFETGYYPTEQSALFAKLRFERLQQKGLLHDFSKPTNHYYSITDSDITCSS